MVQVPPRERHLLRASGASARPGDVSGRAEKGERHSGSHGRLSPPLALAAEGAA